MARRQILLLTLILLFPLALLAALGWRLAEDEQAEVQQQLHDAFGQQLSDVDRLIAGYFQQRERELLELADSIPLQPSQIRERIRREPGIRQIFVLDFEGRVAHPLLGSALNDSERQFLVQFSQVVIDRDLVRLAHPQQDEPNGGDDRQSHPSASHGWYSWFWGHGANIVFWHRRESGQIVGILLERSRWIADVIAALPETQSAKIASPPSAATSSSSVERDDDLIDDVRIRLLDSHGSIVYQWGRYEPSESASPFVDVGLSSPISSWRLQYLVADERLSVARPKSAYFNVLTGTAAAAVALVLLSIVFYREYAREMTQATQRVNFVNQVSHELKTPLTNIRMYADLLECDLERMETEEASDALKRLKVIVSEGQRLSRLIVNVLTFSRQQRRQLSIHPQPANVDDVIAACLDQFGPALREKQIVGSFDGSAKQRVNVDVDAFEQILVNLLSNVEKYAADGERFQITSRQTVDRTTIIVADEGPGIPQRHRDHVFELFYRVSDTLEDVPGTGIGLSVARELARLHGGDLVLEDSDRGARFRVELHTPSADNEGQS